MKDHRKYIKDVDDLLQRLRARCLGQDIPLDVLLPSRAEAWTAEARADQVAKQLLFALSRAEPDFAIRPELTETYAWLKTIVLYLEARVTSEDRTFAAIRRVLDLEEGTRAILFEEAEFAPLQAAPSFLLQFYDAAVLQLLEARGVTCNMKAILETLNSLLHDSSPFAFFTP